MMLLKAALLSVRRAAIVSERIIRGRVNVRRETVVPRVIVPHKGILITPIIARIFALDRLKNYFPVWVFFSSRGRPPPGRRTRSVGRLVNPSANSCFPRLMVFSSIPVT